MKYGIDVSSWQGKIDWSKVKKAGIEFAILRAGFGWGKDNTDTRFEEYYAGARLAGIPVGAYHYSYAVSVSEAKKEAEAFLSRLKGKQFEYPVYYDQESDQQAGLSKGLLTEIADTFLGIVQSNGYYVGLYSNRYWLDNKLDKNYLLKKYDLWLALHTSSRKPDTDRRNECGMWQYTNKGQIPGIISDVDLNVAYKDYPAIIKQRKLNGFKEEREDTVFLRVIRFGDSGEDVGQVQRFLKNRGLYTGPIDNKFGPGQGFLNAVKAFQKAEKLEVDGIIGPKTQARIVELLLQDQENNIKNTAKLTKAKELADQIKNL